MKFTKPTNDWAKTLYIMNLHYLGGVSMATVLSHEPNFYKFQTRLSDILKWHKTLKVSKATVPYISKIDGKQRHYTQYTLISPKTYIHNLYEKINHLGLYKAHKQIPKK
jgi:hypothetical protein